MKLTFDIWWRCYFHPTVFVNNYEFADTEKTTTAVESKIVRNFLSKSLFVIALYVGSGTQLHSMD